jgi:hypothetical protein
MKDTILTCCAVLIVLLGLQGGAMLTRAAGSSPIDVSTAASLALPDSALPAGYTVQPMESYPITRASKLPQLGKELMAQFLREGWLSGYHGWLDATDRSWNAFLTYDFYGFKSTRGASNVTGSLAGLVLGVQTTVAAKRLPAGAQIFIDGTGSYGPEQLPFVAVEVVYRVQNVVADVTGYFAGSTVAATDAATSATISASAVLAAWLDRRSHAAHGGSLGFPLLLPGLAVPAACRSRRRGA